MFIKGFKNYGNLIETWVSDGYPHYIERLPVGKYVLKEEAAPKGC